MMVKEDLCLKYFSLILDEFKKVDIFCKFKFYFGITNFTYKELAALKVTDKIDLFKNLIVNSTNIGSENHIHFYYVDTSTGSVQLLNIVLILDDNEKKELKELRQHIIDLSL